MFSVYLPEMRIDEIGDDALEAAIAAIPGAAKRMDLLDYVPEEGKPPVVFFLFRGEAEKFVELCK